MNESMQLKLAEITIQDIELILNGGLNEMESRVGRIAGINNAIMRYKYYKMYPDRMPEYLREHYLKSLEVPHD